MTINWSFLGWLLIGASIGQMLIGIGSNSYGTFGTAIFCLGVGDIIKAIQTARDGK